MIFYFDVDIFSLYKKEILSITIGKLGINISWLKLASV